MSNKSLIFQQACIDAKNNGDITNDSPMLDIFTSRIKEGKDNYCDLDLEKKRAFMLRKKALLDIEKNLLYFETNFNNSGGKVLWARDADDARKMVLEIIAKENVSSVLRSSSACLDEIALDELLQKNNITVSETSVSRYIAKKNGPIHNTIGYPSMHFTKDDIVSLFQSYNQGALNTSKKVLNYIASDINNSMMNASIGISGANFLISDIGAVVLSENEGNILKMSNLVKTHIIIAGLDKIIASYEDLSLFLSLYSSHTNGKQMINYNTIMTGSDSQNVIVIILDNGRTNLMECDPQSEAMYCIHCNACSNVCPIFRSLSYDAYQSVYAGPIGSIINPLQFSKKEYSHLAQACTLCGKCSEVCPIDIPLTDLIISNRQLVVREQLDNPKLDSMFKQLYWILKSRKRMEKMPLFLKKISLNHYLSGKWKNCFDLPQWSKKSFNELWRDENSEE